MVNSVISRGVKWDRRIRCIGGPNQPVQVFRFGQEDPNDMPDRHKILAGEQKSLYRIDALGTLKKHKRKNPLGDRPQIRGIVLKTLVKKPKKPNSANRKCVLLRLSDGRQMTAYVPGIGHNLQEHSQVLVRYHRVQDVPGLKLKVIRGKYDCSHVVKQTK